VSLERYDLTGGAATCQRAVKTRVAAATNAVQAEADLLELLQSYDVSAGSAGLSAASEKPSLAVSAMVLSELGRGFRECVAEALERRGFAVTPALEQELELLVVWLQQHHVHALLRRAQASILVSAVSELQLQSAANGKKTPLGEPRDLLGVERLEERLPEQADPRTPQSWECERPGVGGQSTLTLVEAVLL
jgi:hypothetical protein